jgi:UDP-N-acetylglucosamine 2-epimerase (non-hydrolysing)
MKIAPLVAEIRCHADLTHRLVHTGQHYDDQMSTVFFDDLEIPRPDIDLEVGSRPRGEQIQLIMERFDPVVTKERPDLVIVVGDVNSTLACAASAKRQGVRVAHVEAGLRSFDLSMPEEHNRRETDRISDFLFATEPEAMANLRQEQVPGKAYLVGNVMIDTLRRHLPKADRSTILQTLGLAPSTYVAATFHRPANVDRRDDLLRLIETIRAVARRIPMVLPLHPRTRSSTVRHGLQRDLEDIPGLMLVEPLGYLDFLQLVRHSRAVITDSGGIQEETTYLQIPCLTMRENTERPITLHTGTNVLVGADRSALLHAMESILANTFRRGVIPDLWDGQAAVRIVAVLRAELGLSASP